MSNRNFDSRVIIQRLQEQNYSRNLYIYNTAGNQIIRNPQNSNGAASRFIRYGEGSQTMYFRGLVGGGVTSSVGGTFDIPPPTAVIVSSITPSTIVSRGWATNIIGGYNTGNGITSDRNNNIYITGEFTTNSFINSYSTLSSGIIVTNTFGRQTSNGNRDIFIAKYNSSGIAQWGTNIGGSLNDTGYGIASDTSSNIYTIGIFSSSCQLNSYSTISSGIILKSTFGTIVASGGVNNIIISKYNSSGIAQWATTISDGRLNDGRGIVTDMNNNIYITGSINEDRITPTYIHSYSTISSGIIITSSIGRLVGAGINNDILLAKYNSSGIAQWATTIGGASQDVGYGIATDTDSNIYVTGVINVSSLIQSFSTISSGRIITSTFGNLVGRGGNDCFVAKYNSSGIAQWGTTIGNTSGDLGYGIATDMNNNIYVTGSFTNSSFIGSYSTISSGRIITNTFGTLLGDTAFSSDIFIAKYNSSGIAEWATNIGGTLSGEVGYGISTDINNNVYVTGIINGSSFINSYNTVSSGIIITSTFGRLISRGSFDCFVAKYNSSGVAQWATNIGDIRSDSGNGITIDMSGNVYVTGNTTISCMVNMYSTVSSGIIITSTFGILIGTRSGTSDAFIVKYNTNGQM